MFEVDNTTIIAIDIQEKLLNMLENKINIAKNSAKILKASSILNIDTIISEQYPKGLGSTIDEIKSVKDFKTVEKTSFSALKTDEFKREFDKFKNKNVILFGIETHICVLQTALDLLKENHNVFILSDCSSSRTMENHLTALELLKQYGIKVITLEIALFEFLKSSKHANFKEIQSLIK